MKTISEFENQQICLGCGKNLSEIGVMTPRLEMFICNVCLIKLGPLEDHYFTILIMLADEIVKLRKEVKDLSSPKHKKIIESMQTTLTISTDE